MNLNSIIQKIRSNYLRGRTIFAMDLVLSLAASIISLAFSRAFLGPAAVPQFAVWNYLAISLIASVILFLSTRTYRIVIRHLSAMDIYPFLISAFGKSLIIWISLLICGHADKGLVLAMLFDFAATLFILIVVRLLMIFVYSEFKRRYNDSRKHQRLLVFGISDKSIAAMVRLTSSTHYKVVGLVKRGDEREHKLLNGNPVINFRDDSDLDRIMDDFHVDGVLFATDGDATSERDGLVAYCNSHGIKTMIVPKVSEGLGDNTLLRELKMEDILFREEIKLSMDAISARLKGAVVMVTGAAGSIGSELVRQLAAFDVKKIVLYDNAETPMHNLRLELEERFPNLRFAPIIGDVRHEERLDFAFRSEHPDVVFHAAAYKHVPLMEENPCEAVLVNVQGTRNVADKCVEYGTRKMVLISTDKAVNPTNIMGCSKRLAEIYVQSLGASLSAAAAAEGKQPVTRFVTTRFGNVLGSNGSVILRFRDQIAKGGPVTVTHPDINRFFMTIPEACRLVLEAATMGDGNEIFVFDMGEPVKIDYLARRMIQLAGLRPDVDIKIEYTGLRPGEKLYEEVLSDQENTLPTPHSRIRVAKVREYPYSEACGAISRLRTLARKVEIPEMVRLMKRTVPEYKSKNSKYEIYDKEN